MNLSSVQGSLDAVWKHYSRVCRAMRRTLVILVLLLFLNVPPLAQATGGTLPMPDKDLPYPPTLDRSDPEELIYFSQYSRDDLLHMPILFNIGFQSFAGLQLSAFASSGVLMSRHEREALAHHLLHTPSNSSTGVEAPSATLSEAEAANLSQILQLQTQGDALRPPLGLQSFTDRYFVEQIGPGILRERFCQRFVELMHIPGMPPLVVDLYTEMIGPFTLWCLFYHSHALQTATRKFVLTATEGDQSTSFSFFSQQMIDVKSKVNLTYLLEHPLLHRLLSVNGNLRHPKFKPLPIGFLYWHRSGQHLLATATEKEKKRELEDVEVHNEYMKLYLQGLNLTALFPHIHHPLQLGRRGCVWLEKALEVFGGGTVDPPIQWIPLDKLPQRITTIYVVLMPIERERRPDRPSLTNEVLVFEESGGRTNQAVRASKHIALLPFTAALYHKLRQHPYGDPSKDSRMVFAFTVWVWRREFDAYLRNRTDLAYRPQGTTQKEFYTLLNNFTFVMSPMGVGYECYRTWESLFFGAIPIIQNSAVYSSDVQGVGDVHARQHRNEINFRGYLDLYTDLPVVVVNDTSDLTVENLEKWKRGVYEKFQRGEYNMEKLFMQYWMDEIYAP